MFCMYVFYDCYCLSWVCFVICTPALDLVSSHSWDPSLLFEPAKRYGHVPLYFWIDYLL